VIVPVPLGAADPNWSRPEKVAGTSDYWINIRIDYIGDDYTWMYNEYRIAEPVSAFSITTFVNEESEISDGKTTVHAQDADVVPTALIPPSQIV
jgi:hypothetical protein